RHSSPSRSRSVVAVMGTGAILPARVATALTWIGGAVPLSDGPPSPPPCSSPREPRAAWPPVSSAYRSARPPAGEVPPQLAEPAPAPAPARGAGLGFDFGADFGAGAGTNGRLGRAGVVRRNGRAGASAGGAVGIATGVISTAGSVGASAAAASPTATSGGSDATAGGPGATRA